MQDQLSLQKIAKKLDISKNTSLDWRLRILSSIEELETGDFVGITELDETFFLFSEKGKKTYKEKVENEEENQSNEE